MTASTKAIFRDAIAATTALALALLAGTAPAQNLQNELVVLEAQVPRYPLLAMSARVSGTVTVDVHVENGVVTTVTPRSGPPLLVFDTVRNVKTWTFGPRDTGDVTSSFEYRIRDSGGANPDIELRLPYRVTITVRPPVVMMVP